MRDVEPQLVQAPPARSLLAPPLVLAYAVVGWSIGARFTGGIIAHVAHAKGGRRHLSRADRRGALLAIVPVVGGGGDPLTAYLAMSSGGADTVAIIAASSETVDLPFAMAFQVGRFMVILLFGPSLARFIAVHACSEVPAREHSA